MASTLVARDSIRHSYARYLGLRTTDPAGIHARILKGLSYSSVENLQRILGISEKRVGELTQISARTLARRKKERRLHPDESDRLLRLSRLVALAAHLFEDDMDDARDWLLAPQPALGGAVPLELARTEIGSREVEWLVGRLEHGIPL